MPLLSIGKTIPRAFFVPPTPQPLLRQAQQPAAAAELRSLRNLGCLMSLGGGGGSVTWKKWQKSSQNTGKKWQIFYQNFEELHVFGIKSFEEIL